MSFLTRSTQSEGLTQARPDQQSGCFLIGFIKICGNIEDESIVIAIGMSVDDLETLTKPGLARWVKMARPLLPDGLWAEIAPLLPPERAKPKGGRPRTSDRAALTG
ncbi:transposase, partial [Methylobacterium sp. SD21]|uniref:transposase n=1 Tax=Methylobacterium litchii TaxID=3138810 RepID=UPI00313E0084